MSPPDCGCWKRDCGGQVNPTEESRDQCLTAFDGVEIVVELLEFIIKRERHVYSEESHKSREFHLSDFWYSSFAQIRKPIVSPRAL